MTTVGELIKRFFPNGTNEQMSDGSNEEADGVFPFWPPDLFALTAALLDSTGCFAWNRYRCGSYFDQDRMKRIRDCAEWLRRFYTADYVFKIETDGNYFKFINSRWAILANSKITLDRLRNESKATSLTKITDAATDLLMIADHASTGAGLVPMKSKSGVAQAILLQHKQYLKNLSGRGKKRPLDLKHIPYSLCKMVPISEACVLPKTRTPQVGCTLRSLSHNLALVPIGGGVRAQWTFGNETADFRASLQEPLNLLVIPFPFQIPGHSFTRGTPYFPHDPKINWRFFGLDQTWLKINNKPVSDVYLANFFKALIESANSHVEKIHGLILPELALEIGLAEKTAQRLARSTNLDFFISGVLDASDNGRLPRNGAFGAFFVSGNPRKVLPWTQYKRHRWMLERFQIEGYHLGDRLHPNVKWWEGIDTSNQDCSFWVFRPGASLVTLICEDLARLDAVQSVIRAVGPNLVVALLLDGAQKEGRWSDRYAAVLADDPGSAVLTVTSLGMINRYALRDPKRESRIIALWKGAEKRATPIELQKDHHAVLLTLFADGDENYSLDSRSDNGGTVALYLSEIHQIRIHQPQKWEWLKSPP